VLYNNVTRSLTHFSNPLTNIVFILNSIKKIITYNTEVCNIVKICIVDSCTDIRMITEKPKKTSNFPIPYINVASQDLMCQYVCKLYSPPKRNTNTSKSKQLKQAQFCFGNHKVTSEVNPRRDICIEIALRQERQEKVEPGE
jgi:hypothetical protein